MSGRLEGEEVALIFLGPSDGSARADVERTLADADAGSPSRVVALNVPVNGDDLDATLEGDELLAGYAGDDGDYSELGRELGRELAESGETPLWDALSTHLVEEREGPESSAVDSAVVALTWTPPDDANGDEEAGAEAQATSSLMEGLLRGLDDAGIPVVGAAASEDDPAMIDYYRDQGISSVDDRDEPAGRRRSRSCSAAPTSATTASTRRPTGSSRRSIRSRTRVNSDFHRQAMPVAARNEEGRIGETVAVLRKDFPEAEILVVDGRSEDGTASRAELWARSAIRNRRRQKKKKKKKKKKNCFSQTAPAAINTSRPGGISMRTAKVTLQCEGL